MTALGAMEECVVRVFLLNKTDGELMVDAMGKSKPTKEWLAKRNKRERELLAYGGGQRGLGHTQLGKPRGLKGSTYGAASEGRKLSAVERRAIEEQMRKDGKL